MLHVDALSRNELPMVTLVDQDEQGIIARLRKAQLQYRNIQMEELLKRDY